MLTKYNHWILISLHCKHGMHFRYKESTVFKRKNIQNIHMHVIISSSFQIGIDFALYFSLLISFHHFSLKHFDYIAPTCQPYCTSLASPLSKRNETTHTYEQKILRQFRWEVSSLCSKMAVRNLFTFIMQHLEKQMILQTTARPRQCWSIPIFSRLIIKNYLLVFKKDGLLQP